MHCETHTNMQTRTHKYTNTKHVNTNTHTHAKESTVSKFTLCAFHVCQRRLYKGEQTVFMVQQAATVVLICAYKTVYGATLNTSSAVQREQTNRRLRQALPHSELMLVLEQLDSPSTSCTSVRADSRKEKRKVFSEQNPLDIKGRVLQRRYRVAPPV